LIGEEEEGYGYHRREKEERERLKIQQRRNKPSPVLKKASKLQPLWIDAISISPYYQFVGPAIARYPFSQPTNQLFQPVVS
jgi:hypothetical protein